MKIYTRTGDKGQTSLLNGKRVPKDSLRIETYGTIDELNSHTGLLRDLLEGQSAELLITVQMRLFDMGSTLSAGDEATIERFKVPQVHDADVEALEKAMDTMDADLPTMRHFILPGGHPAISQAHVCRTVCRRAERMAIRLAEQEPVPEIAVRYLNRLSDFFFMLARWTGWKMNVPETQWAPRG
ncbi:MAG TPA: cob(I)yrinic acid a,c-diamide adenosyltransferase [Flavobacteriales bacterium]|mgnify:CR=1 FL=1|nr:cob(I)yrinic acid a,c-diamide adenosyltransferase [Flavobacteriales bacterium]HRN36002.1 cob(I)yrinic acid a,c-diamide adenosyltransferase [Flavobacteriales bacterium]HRO39239.1 cob(I)yrinic acid a,c-diamide adenosyltransferase [Flavobacteriales bacterium]HRP81491.1 cob(I)yrinic acid a,c-diamide adenosyltransferase [Flavobacteriales bacterium]HRQ83818.1 cob(I)yrinic acid a,c-diamide adenosyltransferase [Flavobacteriales bacterium]